MTYAPAKFEVPTSNSLGEGDRELIIATYPMSQTLRGAPRLFLAMDASDWMILLQ